MKWEYMVCNANQGDLNKLGAIGWELVAVVIDPNIHLFICYLKRESGKGE